ncbi:Zn(II)2Cys6 transcription factor [Aspergillus undulatus]|uniref:Zn(II)2Cys6 transcription factor n=1 Tax=Aspergillus undulatus TaxID=1810928 RepID=UPI003CCD9222
MSLAACDRCHRRKSRCDRGLPSCGRCRKAGVACQYITRDRQNQLDRLQRRVDHLENENRLLCEQLDNQSRSRRQADPTDTGRIQHDAAPNELAEEISFLSSRAGGENRFLGSTSGVLLASLVNATVQTPHGCARRAESSRSATTPSNRSSASHTAFDPALLPDERRARALHNAYFEHDYLAYPFLHPPSALEAVDKAYQDASTLAADAFSYYAFYMILAVSTASVYKFDRESLPDTETYYLRAAERLNEVVEQGDSQALQAVLLLCQYRMVNSVQDTSTSMWHLVGVAARMCLELGLHREQVYRMSRSMSSRSHEDLVVKKEIRRRCFWTVIAMDRIVSITLGRPLAIRLQDTDVALPDPTVDSPVGRQMALESRTQVPRCPAALFVHIVRYRIICGDIMSSLHNGSTRTQADADSALKARDSLADTLSQWHHETGKFPLLDDGCSSTQSSHQSSFRTREWYEVLYYNALLMLYRPSPALSAQSSIGDSMALQNVYNAAKGAITVYAQLHRWKRINYTWVTLHAVFMAGLSYAYSIGRHFRHKRRRGVKGAASLNRDPAIVDIVNDCRTCSNVLVAISERWNMAKNCYDVFNRLSDAVLLDAIEYHTTSQPRSETDYGTEDAQAADGPSKVGEQNGLDATPLAVDSALRECLDDLQHFQPSAYGDDPVGQLSHDWMGEIEGMGFNLFLYESQGPLQNMP